jgi:hypothetical protein
MEMRRRTTLPIFLVLSVSLVAGACGDEDADLLPTSVPTEEVPSDVESVAAAAAQVFCDHVDELQTQLDELQNNPDVDTGEVATTLTELSEDIEADAEELRRGEETQLAQAATTMALGVRTLAQLVRTAGTDPNVQTAIASVAASVGQIPAGACD